FIDPGSVTGGSFSGSANEIMIPNSMSFVQANSGGTDWITGVLTLSDGGVTVGGTLTVGGGTGKINAGTVDPIYTVGGVRYATYMAGMTGVKEETTGVVKLSGKSYTIDFNKLEKGSDAWLFAQTINVGGRSYISKEGRVYTTTPEELFDNMTLLLTPGFDGRVWYEKDVENRKIIIFGSKNGEVSYRLTAPRFDWKHWTNYSDSEWEGLNLDKSLK
ncbi:MAG: hypothetical protein AAB505_01810, partial [Patescibacteria group bacterium]